MNTIIRLNVPDYQIDQEVSIFFKDTMQKRGKCELEKININQFIKVKLTDYGQQIHIKHYDKYLKSIFPESKNIPVKDENGYTKYQLWEFMNIFGAYVFNGEEQIIENNEVYIL